MFDPKSKAGGTPSPVRGGGQLGGKSEAASRQVKISPSFARLGMAREDEQFFLLSHSNRKTGQAQQRLERPGRGLFDISGGNHFIMTVRFPNLSSQVLIPLHLHNIYNPQGKEITDFSITQIVRILPRKIHN